MPVARTTGLRQADEKLMPGDVQVMVHCRQAVGFDVLAAMDTPPVGLIGLQQVGTHRSRRCFGKTPMQTLRGVAHVAYEKSLREHASVGSHG
jgi:hypothetical protein